MGRYSIKDLEKLSGIKAHTLRIWEQRYGVIQPKRTATNIRYYNDEDLRLILNISFLNRNGKKISKISQMDRRQIAETVRHISDSNLEFPNQINAMVIAMVNLDEARFEKIISTNTLQFGFEQTMLNIVFPFLKQIGILWQTGSINPAHEHFISNLIRQKLIVAIDGHVGPVNPHAKKYALFLPEGELHELTLLFSAFLIKSRHNRIIYLGQSLPMQDLETIVEHYQPDFLFTIITNVPSRDSVVPYIQKLNRKFPNQGILLSGYQALLNKDELAEVSHVLSDFHELISYVDQRSTRPFSMSDNLHKTA
ncbi:MAG: MerR family transcriptional regulator [Bacteroidota bacterium]